MKDEPQVNFPQGLIKSRIFQKFCKESQVLFFIYSGPCDLRPPIQPAKYGLKFKVVLKYRDVYTENIQVVSLISGLKMQEIVK